MTHQEILATIESLPKGQQFALATSILDRLASEGTFFFFDLGEGVTQYYDNQQLKQSVQDEQIDVAVENRVGESWHRVWSARPTKDVKFLVSDHKNHCGHNREY